MNCFVSVSAAHRRHGQIEQHHIEGIRFELRQRFLSTAGDVWQMSQATECAAPPGKRAPLTRRRPTKRRGTPAVRCHRGGTVDLESDCSVSGNSMRKRGAHIGLGITVDSPA